MGQRVTGRYETPTPLSPPKKKEFFFTAGPQAEPQPVTRYPVTLAHPLRPHFVKRTLELWIHLSQIRFESVKCEGHSRPTPRTPAIPLE